MLTPPLGWCPRLGNPGSASVVDLTGGLPGSHLPPPAPQLTPRLNFLSVIGQNVSCHPRPDKSGSAIAHTHTNTQIYA